MNELDMTGRQAIAMALHAAGCMRFGDFTLASGQKSPYYLDLRRLQSFPDELWTVSGVMMQACMESDPDRLIAIPHGATPLTSVVAVRSGIGMITARMEPKDHGIREPFDGDYAEDMRVCIIDDLITTGGSKKKALNLALEARLKVVGIWVVVDREQGGLRELWSDHYNAGALLTVTDLIDVYRKAGVISNEQYDIVSNYVQSQQSA